jgi:hypothetical protein
MRAAIEAIETLHAQEALPCHIPLLNGNDKPVADTAKAAIEEICSSHKTPREIYACVHHRAISEHQVQEIRIVRTEGQPDRHRNLQLKTRRASFLLTFDRSQMYSYRNSIRRQLRRDRAEN